MSGRRSALGARCSRKRLETHFRWMAGVHNISRVRKLHERQVVNLNIACRSRKGSREELYYNVIIIIIMVERWEGRKGAGLLHDDVGSDSDPNAISGGFPASKKDNNAIVLTSVPTLLKAQRTR
jgi:hypothetical protein